MDLPDFKSMSPEEIGAWVEANDLTELIKQGVVIPRNTKLPSLDVFAPESISVTFRAPAHLMSTVDRLAGRDKEGRSGILRRAVAEYVERHAGEAA